jgi:serine protease Do
MVFVSHPNFPELLMRLSSFRWISFFTILICFSLASNARGLPDFVDLVKDNHEAVVNISTTHKAAVNPWENIEIPEHSPFNELFKRFLGEGGMLPPPSQEDSKSLGSGFIVSKDGYLITNYHVIENADEIIVRLSDKRELRAAVVGSDKYTDIALLKLEANNLPVVNIGHSNDVEVGSWVLAIGSPFGFDHSVTAGIVSAKGRSLPKANYVPFIQTDVAINPGNSGGPLFDLNGKVIGINSQIYSRTGGFMGLSFAIPIEMAMEVVEQIKTKGDVSRGWLGVYIQEITQELAESFGLDKPVGALVSQIIEDSPAKKYGIKAGDVIVAFNGERIIDSTNLPPLVGRVPVGTKARVKVLRDGKYKTLNVVIEKLEEEETASTTAKQKSLAGNPIGVVVADLNKSDNVELGRGVSIVKVVPSSAGRKAGLRQGDVILQINRVNVENKADFSKKVANLPKGRMIPVLIHRKGTDQFVVLKIPEDK